MDETIYIPPGGTLYKKRPGEVIRQLEEFDVTIKCDKGMGSKASSDPPYVLHFSLDGVWYEYILAGKV